MRLDNFINFFVVNGFFIGLIFSVLKVDNPEEIVVYTVVVTLSFYILALFSSSMFIKFFDFKKGILHKEIYDDILDHYVNEIEKREKIADNLFDFIEEFQKDEKEQQDEIKREIEKKVQESKAK